jgi:hypothetical protein
MMTGPEAHRDGSTDDTGMLSEAYDDVIGGSLDETGAVIMGKRMFEMIDNPDGWVAPNGYQFTWPVFVLTHEAREPVTRRGRPRSSSSAIGSRARLPSNSSRPVCWTIHLVPVFLGGGVRLFDHLGVSPRELEFTGGKQVAGVTHLRFRFRNARNAR